MSKHNKFLDIAMIHAKQSEHEFKMAALVVQGSRIMSRGLNSFKTHPKMPLRPNRKYRKIHAELDAILRCPYEQIEGSVVYVARRLANGDYAMAKPCEFCIKLLEDSGITKVYYTLDHTHLAYEMRIF